MGGGGEIAHKKQGYKERKGKENGPGEEGD